MLWREGKPVVRALCYSVRRPIGPTGSEVSDLIYISAPAQSLLNFRDTCSWSAALPRHGDHSAKFPRNQFDRIQRLKVMHRIMTPKTMVW